MGDITAGDCKDVILFAVPYAIARPHFPWAATQLRDHLVGQNIQISFQMMRFDIDPVLIALFEANKSLLEAFVEGLRHSARFIQDHEPLGFPVAAFFGSHLLEVARETGVMSSQRALLLRIKFQGRLDELKAAYHARLRQIIREQQGAVGEGQRVLWAIQAECRTLFFGLTLATLIKELDNDCDIIMGGEALTIEIVREILGRSNCVDGLVTGPGESVLEALVHAYQRGEAVRDMTIPGLFTTTTIDRFVLPEKEEESYRSYIKPHMLPDFFSRPQELPPAKQMVYRDEEDPWTVRILMQRGCHHGKCAFCDEDNYYSFFSTQAPQLVTEQIGEIYKEDRQRLKSAPLPLPFILRFDGQQTPVIFYKELNRFLLSDLIDHPVVITGYVRIAEFRRELAAGFKELARKKGVISYIVCNSESLSTNGLRKMRKGHLPLQAIECIKALTDVGCVVSCNLFLTFPGQEHADTAEEVAILRRTIHLFSYPRATLVPVVYFSKWEDYYSSYAGKAGVRFSPRETDRWYQRAFGMNLGINHGEYDFVKHHWDSPGIATFLWMRFMRTGPFKKFWRSLMLLWGTISPSRAFAQMLQILNFVVRTPVFASESLVINNSEFMKGVNRNHKATNFTKSSPEFHIWKRILYKSYKTPWLNESFYFHLNPDELQVLRYLYWVRTRKELSAFFDGLITKERLDEIVRKHEALGSILSQGEESISVVNDPEFWDSAWEESDSERTRI